jgi:hypothetical protein
MNEKLKLACDVLWLAINTFQAIQKEADENKGLLSNDIQYEIAGILERTECLLDNELNILSNLNQDSGEIDKKLQEVFSFLL